MTMLLERAFQQASTLPDEEQDEIAAVVLEEMDEERRWDESFRTSQDVLGMLAAEAEADYRAGKTRQLKAAA